MFQKVKKGVFWMMLVSMLSFPLAAPVAVGADSLADACEGLKLADPTATCDGAQAKTGLSTIIKNVINILSIVAGAVSVIMIIIGGLRYVISAGDSSGVSGAKNTILYAIVGLVIVLFAQVIVRFVLTNVSDTASSTSTPSTGGGTGSTGGTGGGTGGTGGGTGSGDTTGTSDPGGI